jgi:uncharacterized damage-inducible protein DinB
MTLEIVDRYAAGGPLLSYATQGLTRPQETARPGPGAWSINELVVHLLDADLVYGDRMKRVLAEENPTLQAFDENAWISRLEAQEMPLEETVNLFVAHRHWMTRLLKRRPESDFARAGSHTQAGRKTLADLVVSAANHLDHHLTFLYGKRGNLGVALYPRYTHITEA